VNFNQTINASNPGIIAVLLDEIASRGRFTWRNSFGVLNSLVLPDNKTFNELLDWSVWAYDVSAGQWLKSITRMERGVTFPSGWYDGRVIMVGVQPEGSAGLDLWSFLQPFSAGVWVMIGVTVVISGIVYWFLDWFDTDSDSLELDKRPGQSIFLSFLAFTGQFEFRPVSSSAQIFTASLSFWALIMMSAYTANLASFLVVQNTPSIKINTVGDAVLNNYVICVVRSATPDNALTVAWPEARVLRTQTELEMYERVRNGTCQVMLTTMSSWNEYEGDATVNGDCRLGWIGRVFLEGEGGFAVKSDSGTLCSSLVRDVFNLHMEEMKDDGFLQSTWDDFLKRHETVDCMGNVGTEEDNNSNQLSLNAMGGTFVLHYIMTAFATLLAFAWKCRKKYRPSTHKRWGISARNVTGDCENGVNTVEKSGSVDQASIDTGIRLESLVDKQNEKLTELAKQNMDMLATINAMKSELSSVGTKEEGGGLKF
jgi:hypothetical protein